MYIMYDLCRKVFVFLFVNCCCCCLFCFLSLVFCMLGVLYYNIERINIFVTEAINEALEIHFESLVNWDRVKGWADGAFLSASAGVAGGSETGATLVEGGGA